MSKKRGNFSLDFSCEFCEGAIRHQPWCFETNEYIRNVFRAAMYRLTPEDEIRLASLGVTWGDPMIECEGKK
jgi:hypothetical protein